VLRKAVTAVLSKSTPVKSAKPVSDAATDAPHVDHGEGDLAEGGKGSFVLLRLLLRPKHDIPANFFHVRID